MRFLVTVIFVNIICSVAMALPPNFNLNAGRRMARYAIANDYTFLQIDTATAEQTIAKIGLTRPEYIQAIADGWAEIKSECIRVYKLNRPSPRDILVSDIKQTVFNKWPNATITFIDTDRYTIDLGVQE